MAGSPLATSHKRDNSRSWSWVLTLFAALAVSASVIEKDRSGDF